jgi:hypothetical protein
MRYGVVLAVLLCLCGLRAAEAWPQYTIIPEDSQCYHQNTSCSACTGYEGEACVWTLTSWPPIQCWPAEYDAVRGRWVANTTAYLAIANATAPDPAPPMWTPVQDWFKCAWHADALQCADTCLARIENDDNNRRRNGEGRVRYSRNEMRVAATFNTSDYTQANWNSLGFDFYEVSMDGGSGDVAIGPPTCNFQISYGTKPVGVAGADASISSQSFMLMFDSYFFYSTADYPTGWTPGGVVDPPAYTTLMNLTIQGNASVILNGTVVNTVTLLPQNYAGTPNQFNLTCYWSNVPFYYDADHYIAPYTTKCDIQMANLTYPEGTDAVALRVVAMSSVEEHQMNQHEGDQDGGDREQSHTSLGAGTFIWDPTVYLNDNTTDTATVYGHGPLACGEFEWLTSEVRAYLLEHVKINPANILCNYFSFATASEPKFMWDPEIGLDLNATDTPATTTPAAPAEDIRLALGLGIGLGGAALLVVLGGLIYFCNASNAPPAAATVTSGWEPRPRYQKVKKRFVPRDIEFD